MQGLQQVCDIKLCAQGRQQRLLVTSVARDVIMAGYQLSPFDVGQIKAHMHHGLKPADIMRILLKPDGISSWSFNAINDAVKHLERDPSWRGERAEGSGRPRETTASQDNQIVRYITKYRGQRKVTVSVLKRDLPWLREFSNSLVDDRIEEADLKWLRRREKSKVAQIYLEARVDHSRAVKRKHQATLDTWAYTDGRWNSILLGSICRPSYSTC